MIERNNEKYILFVGLGQWYEPLIGIAKRRGFKTIVTNKNPNAPVLKYADISIIIDGNNALGIMNYLKNYSLDDKITYVYTGTELFSSVSIISEMLGIPWHNVKASLICENKEKMREMFIKNNISCPKGKVVNNEKEELDELFIKNNKIITKPIDGVSSQGVCIFEGKENIEKSIKYTLNFSKGKKIVCEQFIEGILVDINGIITKNKFFRMGISEKTPGQMPNAVITELKIPTKFSTQIQERAYRVFEKACRSIGLENGPVKGDMIIDKKNKIYFLEIGPRFHGPLGSLYLIPRSLKITPFEELIKMIQNKQVKEHNIHKLEKEIRIIATDDKNKFSEKEVLEKPGIKNRQAWKSNNDVPFYCIFE